MANEPSLDEMKTGLQELYKTNPHILEGIRATTDPDIIKREYYQNLPKMVKKIISTNTDIINQEPSYYMKEFTFAEVTGSTEEVFKYEIGASLFKLYEAKQEEIYSIIQQNDPAVLLESLNEEPHAFLIDIFAEGSNYMKNRISFKTKQEIQCENNNPIVESYITQAKSDWTRTPFFSNKYNKYVIKLSGLPYTDKSPAVDKLFLITANAINNYFIQDSANPALGLQIVKDEPIDDTLGETDCECKKVKNSFICSEFNILPDLTDNVKKILYNLSFVNQAQKSQIMLQFNALLQAFPAQYENVIRNTLMEDVYITMYNFGHGAGYYYVDAKKQTFVYFNSIIAVLNYKGDTLYVPLYNLIQVYPFAMNDYYYSFLYMDNNPPATVGKGKWYERTPATMDFYKFLTEKIQWYAKKYDENPDNFIRGNYRGADYINYIKEEAKAFNKTHKPYVYTYKSRPFVEPDFSRLLGGRTKHKGTKHKGTKHKGTKHKGTKYKVTKHKGPKHKVTKHKVTKHKVTKHKVTKHKVTKHKGTKYKRLKQKRRITRKRRENKKMGKFTRKL